MDRSPIGIATDSIDLIASESSRVNHFFNERKDLNDIVRNNELPYGKLTMDGLITGGAIAGTLALSARFIPAKHRPVAYVAAGLSFLGTLCAKRMFEEIEFNRESKLMLEAQNQKIDFLRGRL